MEEPVTFHNKNGKKLYGIVHVPDGVKEDHKKIGINLLNPGIKYRVAPHRLNVKLARELCRRGYYVLRFDPEGIGDSEGELPAGSPVGDIWSKIQSGLLVADTVSANDFFVSRYGIEKLIVMGNCGGAITSVLTTMHDPKIDAIGLIDVPVFYWTSSMTTADLAIEGSNKADWLFSEYLKRSIRMESWYRFLTFQTDYRALLKIFLLKFKRNKRSSNSKFMENLERLGRENNLNINFFKALDGFLRRNGMALFVLAEKDHGTELFKKYVQDGYFRQYDEVRDDFQADIFTVDHANHIYTFTEWQTALMSKITTWVDATSIKLYNR